MTAFASAGYNNCCFTAAGTSSALIRSILDTAVLLVVSICVLCLRIILPLA